MAAVDNTGTVLYHFLRALSVKVSRSTVHRLLDTPVGNSMRGISDALDALHVKNEVYQLPPTVEYFSQLDAPFITMRQVDGNPFCVVTKNTDSIVEFRDSEGKKRTMPIDKFLKHWAGNTLFAEITPETPVESFCFWKDGLFFVLKYKVVIAILLLVTLGLSSAFRQNASNTVIAYLSTLAFGILVSVAILYKELFNEHFMERFCHIGKVVDCNEVIHSKGATVAGIGLGELSLFCFGVLFFYGVVCLSSFYTLSVIVGIVSLCFTVYSVIYQSFIIRKGCMLCMLVNITVWGIAVEFYWLKDEFSFSTSLYTLCTFAAIGIISLILGMAFDNHRIASKEKHLLEEHLSNLLKPSVFQNLLDLEPQIKEDISITDLAMNNPLQSDKRLLVVTNPNCRNCAKVHPYIKELSTNIPMEIILVFYDNVGRAVCGTILTAYLQEGWNKAMQLLEEWFVKHTLAEADKYPITDAAKEMLQGQVMYCKTQEINRTPSAIINGHYVPEVYSLSSLKYVWT